MSSMRLKVAPFIARSHLLLSRGAVKCGDYELWLWHPPVLVHTLVIRDTCSETLDWLFTLSAFPNRVDAQQLLLHMGEEDACQVCVNSQSFIEVHVWSRTCAHTQLSFLPLDSLRIPIPNKLAALFVLASYCPFTDAKVLRVRSTFLLLWMS